MQTVAVAFREDADIVARIDRLVIERRRSNPEGLFSRAQYVREAVLRSLAEDTVPQVRERVRSSAAA